MASLFLTVAAACGTVGILVCYVCAIYARYQKAATSQRTHPVSGRGLSVYMGKKTDFTRDWWTSEKQLELEFRAVLSKEWLLATHTSRFRKPGDYHSMTIGGFPILLVLGKDKTIRGFHDVCRHRAYKVTKKSTGSTLVFGCRYHGWSYDTTGALVRAPEFEEVPTFRWDQNGLFPVNTRVSTAGLIFVNFQHSSIEPHFQSNSLADILPQHTVSPTSALVKELELDGAFNWKLAAGQSFAQTVDEARVVEARIFPAASICWSDTSPFWISLIHEPISANKTHLRFDVYAMDSSAVVSKPSLDAIEHGANLYVQSLECLHGKLSNKLVRNEPLTQSVLDFQNEIQLRAEIHTNVEKVTGRTIQSISLQQNVSKQGLEDDLFSKQLQWDCESLPCDKVNKELAW